MYWNLSLNICQLFTISVCVCLNFLLQADYKSLDENVVAPMKKEFNNKLNTLLKRKKSNSINLITKERYQTFIQELTEIKFKPNKDFNDYKMLASYDIIALRGMQRLIQPRTESNNHIKFYVYTDELFGIIHTMHLLYDHAGKQQLEDEIKSKYCNVSKEAIRIYMTCCKVCKDRIPNL